MEIVDHFGWVEIDGAFFHRAIFVDTAALPGEIRCGRHWLHQEWVNQLLAVAGRHSQQLDGNGIGMGGRWYSRP